MSKQKVEYDWEDMIKKRDLEIERIERQNKRYRQVLSYVCEIDCIDWNKEELAEMARKELEESE